MAKDKSKKVDKNKSTDVDYMSIKEERRISRENRKVMKQFEAVKNRKNVDESEYLAVMKDPNNVVEFDNLHTYF